MKWFKHDTTATMTDVRLRKLILKHGATGYAVYFRILEIFYSEGKLHPDDSKRIAEDLNIVGTFTKSGSEIVEDILKTINKLKLLNDLDEKGAR